MKCAPDTAVAHIREWLQREAAAGEPAQVHRLEVELTDVDPLRWLQVQPDPVKGFWSAREEKLQIGALGEAEVIRGGEMDGLAPMLAVLQGRLAVAPGARYFGGFRFGPPHPVDPSWQAFGAYRFLLPKFELIRTAEHTRLACNFLGGTAALPGWLAALDALRFSDPPAAVTLPEPALLGDRPDRGAWGALLGKARAELDAGRLFKVVLARQRLLDFGLPLDPFALLARLRTGSPECYLFGGVHAGLVSFMGAPPERLYRRDGRRIETEAVAGTRPRGDDADQDHALAVDLARSAKEQEEHRVVVAGIHEALAPLCKEWMQESRPRVAKFRTVQHLVTHCRGRLREGITDAEILTRLHPTAAVAGHPREAAVQAITAWEPFDRGWYSGPVGWIAADSAEFAVAIRCGLVAGSRLCLFAGAGIMSDADPEAEWQETEAKLGAFIAALTTR